MHGWLTPWPIGRVWRCSLDLPPWRRLHVRCWYVACCLETDAYFLLESADFVDPPVRDLFYLWLLVGLHELLDRNISAADPDHDLTTLLDLDADTLWSKSIDAFRLSQENNLKLPFLSVYELCQGHIDFVDLLWDIQWLLTLQVVIGINQLLNIAFEQL